MRSRTRTDITIILPLKNGNAEFLRAAIESVSAQTSPHWLLLVVVEPGALAESEALLTPWIQDARVRVISNEGKRLAGAINTGMRAADTDFVALLLGDDLWHPSAVETLEWHIGVLPSVDFFHSARQVIDDAGEPISSAHPAQRDVTLRDFESTAPVKHLLCWRREKGLAVGGLDERSRSVGPDDFDFPWTMAEHGVEFFGVESCLYLYRDHRTSARLTTHVPRSIHVRELRRIFRKHGLDRRMSRQRVREARETYLQQCLYRTRGERWFRELLRRPPRRVWRDTYL